MNIRGTFTVIGTVQGVRYRETVLGLAKAQGLAGFVRNQKNGAVKVVTEGDEITVKAFHQRLEIRQGRIQVDKVIPRYSAAKGRFTRFRILRGPDISDGELEIMERLDSGLVLMDRLGEKQDATRDDIKTMDSNIGGHFERLEGRQDATTGAVKAVSSDLKAVDSNIRSVDSHIKSMDSNIGGHFDRLDTKYDAFGASLAQAADDIHDMKGDMHVVKGDISVMKGDLRKAVSANQRGDA